jgi:hypothetical protein
VGEDGVKVLSVQGHRQVNSAAGSSIFPTPEAFLNPESSDQVDRWPYFHSQTVEVVAPDASTSYSKAPQALLSGASFCDVVRKKSMPR